MTRVDHEFKRFGVRRTKGASLVAGYGEGNRGSELGDWWWERVGGSGRCTRWREHVGGGRSAGAAAGARGRRSSPRDGSRRWSSCAADESTSAATVLANPTALRPTLPLALRAAAVDR
ncbi:Os02g0468850 [Oryza sativa Japonica Group]|uniref:Os02g0468850 protein n=1 Tax=Oryza sativa subsp. japonica TaxID=39947 RepID=A0A0P0VIW2_ORYSJ|nr:Os02g0468850 [Oryza sativa Japonica Group]